MGTEFKAIILSVWKNLLHFAWKFVPNVSSLFVLLMFMFWSFRYWWSIYSVHFNGLSWLVLVIRDIVANRQNHPCLCVTRLSAHGVSSFDILLYLLLLLNHAITWDVKYLP